MIYLCLKRNFHSSKINLNVIRINGIFYFSLLIKTLDTSFVRAQDMSYVVSLIAASNSLGRQMAYNFMEENWDEFVSRYGLADFELPSLALACTSLLTKEADLIRVQNFVARKENLGAAVDAFQQSMEKIKMSIRWSRQNMHTIFNWLQNNEAIYY